MKSDTSTRFARSVTERKVKNETCPFHFPLSTFNFLLFTDTSSPPETLCWHPDLYSRGGCSGSRNDNLWHTRTRSRPGALGYILAMAREDPSPDLMRDMAFHTCPSTTPIHFHACQKGRMHSVALTRLHVCEVLHWLRTSLPHPWPDHLL